MTARKIKILVTKSENNYYFYIFIISTFFNKMLYSYKITSIGVTLTVISLLGQAPIAPPEFDENEAAPRRLFPG